VGGLTARRRGQTASSDAWGGGGTLNSPKNCPDGPLMGRAKPYTGGGLGAQVSIIQYKS
jgi:hypothetical protein